MHLVGRGSYRPQVLMLSRGTEAKALEQLRVRPGEQLVEDVEARLALSVVDDADLFEQVATDPPAHDVCRECASLRPAFNPLRVGVLECNQLAEARRVVVQRCGRVAKGLKERVELDEPLDERVCIMRGEDTSRSFGGCRRDVRLAHVLHEDLDSLRLACAALASNEERLRCA